MANESKAAIDFKTACGTIEAVLSGPKRREIAAKTPLTRFGDAMRRHRFEAIALDDLVARFDRLGREDGFHVLHDWDGTVDKLNPETIPVDVTTFMLDMDVSPAAEPEVVALLLDYYFLYVMALLTLRMWDAGDPDDNFDRLEGLLHALQGPGGSGQKFVSGAATLLLVAVSHYESDERAFDRLLAKLATLDRNHREKLALVLAGIFGSHLRFGFEATYGRDIVALRNDNGPDYPWLLFALSNLMEAYDAGSRDERVLEGLVNGLSPDPRAFVGKAPDSLASHRTEHDRFRMLFDAYRGELLEAFEAHRPSERRYSPVAFYFNFLHNTLKAIVVDALLRGTHSNVAVDHLLTGFPESESKAREGTARTLMAHARANPDEIRGRWVPVIVYDPRKGRRAFADMIRRIC